jgi:hypothetical protein
MINIPETNNEDEIWKARKNALLGFVNNKKGDVAGEIVKAEDKIDTAEGEIVEAPEMTLDGIPDKEVRSVEQDLAKLEKLKDRLEENVVPGNINEWSYFLQVYEQRQRKICYHLLDLLKKFTEDAAKFLQQSSEDEEDNLQRHRWRVLLNKVSIDLLIVSAAAEQRTHGENDQTPTGVSTANTLLKADIISEQALAPAVEREFLQKTSIITYLRENVSIHTVPYSEVVLISVAYASMEPGFSEPNTEGISFSKVSRDMLAIPHEVGHQLYREGQLQLTGGEKSISSYLQEQLKQAQIWGWDWRSDWLEEIFADAYGLLVAGPVMAISFQDLLTDNLPSRFSEDTGRHPIPALRPYIQTIILRRLIKANGNSLYPFAPNELDKKWEEKPIWNGAKPLEEDYKLHGVPNPAKGQQILDGLDEIIDIVLETLRRQAPLEVDTNLTYYGWKAWTEDVLKGEDPERLYNKLTFERFFPLSSSWFQTPVGDTWTTEPKKWPEQILSGWREKAPEDHGG